MLPDISLSPSSIRLINEPSQCEKRAWLKAHGANELPPSDFQQLLFVKGADHEARVVDELLQRFPGKVDLGGPGNPVCEEQTAAALEARDGSILFQAGLRTETVIDGTEVTIVGYPDFLLPEGEGWVIGDAKLTSTTLNKPRKDGSQTPKGDKRYIHNQLQLYSWLLREIYGIEASELRIYTGRGTVELVEDDGGSEALELLANVLRLQRLTEEPFEAVGWSKCKAKACTYRDRCWPKAVEEKALGLIPKLNVSQVNKLRDDGLDSYDQVLRDFDERSLAELKSEGGGDDLKQRAWARRLLESAAALESEEAVPRCDDNGDPVPLPAEVSSDANYVMFDLEGDAADAGLPVDIYLWGLQVFGGSPGEYMCAAAPFREDDSGVEEAWWEFLSLARGVFDEHPGIRFVHWAEYEKTWVTRYIDERFGDDEHGTGAEVLASLLDLRPIAEKVVAFPTPSYSLKIIEPYVGFVRQEDDISKGDESMVVYTAAKASSDPEIQEKTLASIAAYNREDLEGTWMVHQWLVNNIAHINRNH